MSHRARTRRERRVARQRQFVHAPKRGASSSEGQTAGRTMARGRGPRGIRDLLRYDQGDDSPEPLKFTIAEILTTKRDTMGVHQNITATKFPKQGRNLGKPCIVMFNYDASSKLQGTIIRDDAEDPFEIIISLDDGRVVRGSECQYSPR